MTAAARRRTARLAAAAALVLGAGPVAAQGPADPNLAHPHEIVTVARDGYTISGLAVSLPGSSGRRHGIALFPGHPGILRLREENGQPAFDLRGNFLVRSRRHWLDAETLVLMVDAPSDEWAAFPQHFRETPRYGDDVRALIEEAGRRHRVAEWTFVGTSEGSVSAFHAARMNPGLARRLVLTSSVFSPSRHGPGLSGADFGGYPHPLLWVHHAEDPCRYTAYGDAKAFAARTGRPLVTVRGGGPWRGAACEAHTAHGFAGLEREVVAAMQAWVKTGAAPADVGP
ncbi:MAG: hypothetical protein JNK22_17780 [Rhodocyclaceae bacterium]|nr:hypothetical protein [Rhodocyclaceae bacterium]